MALTEYQRKRRFSRTREPKGRPKTKIRSSEPTFVIQKHAASRLHYDLRLEFEGVLKSWAVPKGPSLDPKEKRLAVEVEDHPLEYADFEGSIPAGEYGGGEVIVWDRGTWTTEDDVAAGLKSGKLTFQLQGEKLQGEWALVRIRGKKDDDKSSWLLIKHRDEFATAEDLIAERPDSVKSGKSIDDIREGRPARKKSTAKKRATKKAITKSSTLRLVRKSLMPANVEPQLATLTDKPPMGDQWQYEVKFDGYRIMAMLNTGKVKLHTRNQLDWTHRYQSVAAELADWPVKQAILDGEMVALLPSGVTSFQSLQNAAKNIGPTLLAYYVFDLLYLDGRDLRAQPLSERRKLLESIIPRDDNRRVKLSESFVGEGDELLAQCCKMGLEGIICKRADRPYVSKRSTDWLKCKCLGSEELVIGGYTISTAIPRGIGALLLGFHDTNGKSSTGKLTYAGRVGTGFTNSMLLRLRKTLEGLKQDDSPFVHIPPRDVDRSVRWVKPQLVAQLEFTSWTDTGVLRHPSFKGLREDKPATKITCPPSRKLVEHEAEKMKKPSGKSKAPAKGRKHAADLEEGVTIPLPVSVKLTHPERIIFPEVGLTKLGLATYYANVAKWMLPHVVNRPLSLVRCPDGASGKCFFQKHGAAGTPKELGRVEIAEKDGKDEYLFIRDVEGLVSIAQISALEVHIWGSRCDRVDSPDRITFDLDPHEDVSWAQIAKAAEQIRELLKKKKLRSFVKTTGGKGLHIVVPINPRRKDWKQAKAFSKELADSLAKGEPQSFTTNMAKAARTRKIFIDYLRNDHGSTAIAPFSTRSKPTATVSVPVEWDELDAIKSDHFTVANVMGRLKSQRQDPWEGIDELKQSF